jgi:hypothetical protein
MNKLRVISDWGFKMNCEVDRPVDLYVDTFKGARNSSDAIKLLILFEPEELSKSSKEVIENHKLFDFILTHNEDVLKNCSNSILFEYGDSWIDDEYVYPNKKFEVSALVGFKKITEGHLLRHNLWDRQDEIKIPKKFFISRYFRGVDNKRSNPVLGENKDPLFDSQFHIVIENVKKKYWFTEKLIDSIKTKSVPIYWGCPNIGEYFNTDGMIIVNSLDEIINVCNNLTEYDYLKRLSVVEENFEKGKEYENLMQRVKNKIQELTKI